MNDPGINPLPSVFNVLLVAANHVEKTMEIREINLISSTIVTFSIVLGCIGIYRVKCNYAYWAERGMPFLPPHLFFFSFLIQSLMQEPKINIQQRIYKRLTGHKFGVFYHNMMEPTIMILNPAIIKKVLCRSFENFEDRSKRVCPNDHLAARLGTLKGWRWRHLRQMQARMFSAEKIKRMHHFTVDCLSHLDDFLSAAIASSGGGEVNLSELMMKLTIDLMRSLCLSSRCRAFKEEDSDLTKIVKRAQQTSGKKFIWNSVQLVFGPKLIPFAKNRALGNEDEKMFRAHLRDEMQRRRSSNFEGDDYLQLMMNAQDEEFDRSQSPVFTDDVLASSIFDFLTVGSETLALFFVTFFYEMVLNPDIYERMKDEVESVKLNHGGNLEFEASREVPFVQMVVEENLRKHPGSYALDRLCTETFVDNDITVNRGTRVSIPVYSLHMDAQYFPEPEIFKPERFDEENKRKIVPGTYLPFGNGKRMCIAHKLSMYIIKYVILHTVMKYKVHKTKKTKIPLKYDFRKSFVLAPAEDIWIKFEERRPS